MKRTLLLIAFIFFITINGNSQSYGFTKTTANYTAITNSISINNGVIWDDPDYSIPTGFTYQLFGSSYDSIYMGVGLGGYIVPSKDLSRLPMPLILLTSADLVDRGELSSNNISLSPLSYSTSGNVGSRIFKLQYNNAGFYNDIYTNQGLSTDYINMQMWIYESNGNIEYHFGASNVTQPFLDYDGSGPSHGLSPSIDIPTAKLSNNSILLTGLANSPNAVIDSTYIKVNGTPPNGTVYRFINGGTVSVKELLQSNQINLAIYPNPTTQAVSMNIDQNDLISNIVSIYNMNGQLVSIKEYQSNIEVSELNNGTYFLEVFTKEGRGVAKFIKQ